MAKPFGAHRRFEDEAFKGIEAAGRTIDSLEFIGCTFEACVFVETRFVACRFEGCTFSGCELSAASIEDCTVIETAFARCKLLGVNWARAKTTFRALEARFERSALDGASFLGLDLRRVAFAYCRAHEVNFSEANLSGVAFSRTDLAGAVFLHTDLTGADFRTAKNYALHLADNAVEGARFSFPEAIALLKPFGVEVDFGQG